MTNEKELNDIILSPGKAYNKELFEHEVICDTLELKLKYEKETINHIVNYLIDLSNEYKNNSEITNYFIILNNLNDELCKELELEIIKKLSTNEIYHSSKIINIRVLLRNILSVYIEVNNLVTPILRIIPIDVKSTLEAKEEIIKTFLKDLDKGDKINLPYYDDNDILYYIYLINKKLNNYGKVLKSHCILIVPNTFNLYNDDINPIAILEEVFTNTNIELIPHEH